MIRLLLAFALTAVTFTAAAHNGHHAPAVRDSNVPESAPAPVAERSSTQHAAVSGCPTGGGQEVCSCHGLSCTSPFQPATVADAPVQEIVLVLAEARLPHVAAPALRPVAALHFSPRGPPLFS